MKGRQAETTRWEKTENSEVEAQWIMKSRRIEKEEKEKMEEKEEKEEEKVKGEGVPELRQGELKLAQRLVARHE